MMATSAWMLAWRSPMAWLLCVVVGASFADVTTTSTNLSPLCDAKHNTFGARGHVLGSAPPAGPPVARHIASTMATTDRLAEKPPLPLSPASTNSDQRNGASGNGGDGGGDGSADTTLRGTSGGVGGARDSSNDGGSTPSLLSVEVVVSDDPSSARQRIEGFGGALTHSAAEVFAEAPAAVQECLLKASFGADGHMYTLGRLPIGTSDFAPYHFSHADTPGDVNLSRFSVRRDLPTLIPLVHAVKAAMPADSQSLRLVATPWR
jgi:hypothetical protein